MSRRPFTTTMRQAVGRFTGARDAKLAESKAPGTTPAQLQKLTQAEAAAKYKSMESVNQRFGALFTGDERIANR